MDTRDRKESVDMNSITDNYDFTNKFQQNLFVLASGTELVNIYMSTRKDYVEAIINTCEELSKEGYQILPILLEGKCNLNNNQSTFIDGNVIEAFNEEFEALGKTAYCKLLELCVTLYHSTYNYRGGVYTCTSPIEFIKELKRLIIK